MNVDVLHVAAYCVSGVFLVDALLSGGDAPRGVDPEYWRRAIRAWRHRRAKR